MELSHAVLVLAGSLVVLAIVVAAAVVRASEHIARAVAEGISGVFDTGARPEIDYEVFDEALAALHLQQAEEIQYGGELTLEYDPVPVDSY